MLKLFVSYSHADSTHRRALEVSLSTLKRQGLIEVWFDHQIATGVDIDKSIKDQLQISDVILLLVSPDFIASDYCYSIELAAAMQRHEANRALVVPIILRPCDWESLAFGRLKALPANALPVTKWEDADSAFLDIAKSLRVLVESEKDRKLQEETPSFVKTARDCIKLEFNNLQERYEARSGIISTSLTTGLKNFDELLGGIPHSSLTIVSSTVGDGCSDFVLSVGITAHLKKKIEVLFVSPRETGDQVMRRAICGLGVVSRSRVLAGALEDEDWSRISHAITLLAQDRFFVDDSRVVSSKALIGRINQVCAAKKIKLIVIDGIDYFVGNGLQAPADEELSFILRSLKEVGAKHGLALLISLPIPEGPFTTEPTLRNIFGPTSIPREADQIVLLQRENYLGIVDDSPSVEIVAHVLKNQHGLTGAMYLDYEPKFHRFSEREQ